MFFEIWTSTFSKNNFHSLLMFLLSVKSLCRYRNTPCPNLWGDRRDQTKIYCQATVCQRRVFAVPWTIKLGLTMVRNQVTPLKYS